jgi:hypothetical protein
MDRLQSKTTTAHDLTSDGPAPGPSLRTPSSLKGTMGDGASQRLNKREMNPGSSIGRIGPCFFRRKLSSW